jgi:hypothetical protein
MGKETRKWGVLGKQRFRKDIGMGQDRSKKD